MRKTIVDFGWWTTRDGRRFLLSWNAASGWLSLDGDRIAHIKSPERLQNLLLGWEDHCLQPNSINWLVSRLDGAR